MKVFIVFEVVDLGDHVVSVHYKEEDAARVTAKLQAESVARYGVERTYYWCDEHEVE